MVTIANGNWIVDLASMTCRNVVNKVVVKFENRNKCPQGKIEDMPMELFAEWARKPHGERLLEKVVMEAHEVFWRAYIENDFDKQDMLYKDLEDIDKNANP